MKIGSVIERTSEPRVAEPHDEHHGFDTVLKQAKQPATPRAPRVAKPAPDDASIDTSAETPIVVARPDVATEIAATPANDAPPSLLAAISHAIAVLRGTPPQVAAPTDAIEAPAIDGPEIATPTLTPLEQAVHDMLAELAPVHPRDAEPHEDHDEPADAPAPANPNAPLATTAPTPAHDGAPRTHAAEPPPALREMQAPEMSVAQSHVHLIVGDDAERVVVTVAVRGNDVNVALRAGDEHTAAALARNAGALDHALRTRGLDLASFSAQRDPDDRRRREQPHRERPPEPQQPFVLEQP